MRGTKINARTRVHRRDDALFTPGEQDGNAISTAQRGLLSPRQAAYDLAGRNVHEHMASEVGDDLAVEPGGALRLQIASRYRASSFAAQMKSFSERPPTEWVLYCTRQRL